jgi:hypothetical protein
LDTFKSTSGGEGQNNKRQDTVRMTFGAKCEVVRNNSLSNDRGDPTQHELKIRINIGGVVLDFQLERGLGGTI